MDTHLKSRVPTAMRAALDSAVYGASFRRCKICEMAR